MGGCVSVSSQSSCSSKSNGERVPPSCLWIDVLWRNRSRTFSDHVSNAQHLSSVPNRIFTNGRSRSSCIFTQQGRKGVNQDAMIVWEVSSVFSFFLENVTGYFGGYILGNFILSQCIQLAELDTERYFTRFHYKC